MIVDVHFPLIFLYMHVWIIFNYLSLLRLATKRIKKSYASELADVSCGCIGVFTDDHANELLVNLTCDSLQR